MTWEGIAAFSNQYSPYVDGTIISVVVLLIVGYFGKWMERCHIARISSYCVECLRRRANRLVFVVAIVIQLALIAIYALLQIRYLDKGLWESTHIFFAVVYPLLAVYIAHHLYAIHVKYDNNIVVFIQSKPAAFLLIIANLLFTIFCTILEWITLINRVHWESSDQIIQITMALFGLDATAAMLVAKMKEMEHIRWAFTAVQDSGFEAVEQFLTTKLGENRILRCSCNTFLFFYFGLGIVCQMLMIALCSYTSVENRLNDAETWLFYATLPFVFAPLPILTFFIYQHDKFLVEVDYTAADATLAPPPVSAGSQNMEGGARKRRVLDTAMFDEKKLRLRQRKLDRYKCMDRVYQFIIVMIFMTAVYLVLIAGLSPNVAAVDYDLYLFSQLQNFMFVFLFLWLLFLDNKQLLDVTWKCHHCLFVNDAAESTVFCALCGVQRDQAVDVLNDESRPLLQHWSALPLQKKHKEVLLMVQNQHADHAIHKKFVALNISIKLFGVDYLRGVQCDVEAREHDRDGVDVYESLKQCQCVQRILALNLLYQKQTHDSDENFHRDFDDLTSEKQYEIRDLLDDFAHLLKLHSFGIHNQDAFEFVEETIGVCDDAQCKFATRHFGGDGDGARLEADADGHVQATAEMSLDADLLYRSMDRIHCFLCHNYQRDRQGVFEQVMSAKRKVLDDEKELVDEELSTDDEFDDDAKEVEKVAVMAQHRKTANDARHRFEAHRLQATEAKEETDSKTTAQDQEVDDGGVTAGEAYANFAEYSFGSFIYYELLTPKFRSLKDELFLNEMHRIDQRVWQLKWAKAQKLSESRTAKKLRNLDNALLSFSIEHILSIVLYCDCTKLQFHFRASFRKERSTDDNRRIIQRHCSNFYHWGQALNDAIYLFGEQMKSGEKLFHGLSLTMLFESFSTDFNTPTSTTKTLNKALSFATENGIVMCVKPKWKDDSKWNRTKKMEVSWISDYSDEAEHLFYGNFNQLLIDEIWDVQLMQPPQPCSEYIIAMQLLQMMCDGNVGNLEYNMDAVQTLPADSPLLDDGQWAKVNKHKQIYQLILLKLIANELKLSLQSVDNSLKSVYKKHKKRLKKGKKSPIQFLDGSIPTYVSQMMHYFCANRQKIAILNGMQCLKQLLVENEYQHDNMQLEMFVFCPHCNSELSNHDRFMQLMDERQRMQKIFTSRSKKCSYCLRSMNVAQRSASSANNNHRDQQHELLRDTFHVCCNDECQSYLKYFLCESCLVRIPRKLVQRLFPNAKFYHVLPVLDENKQNALKVELLRSIGFL